MTIAELIADKLATELFHPGDPEAGQLPMTMQLPMFRAPVGIPAEVYQQVAALNGISTKLVAEAIVHLIETDGQCDIVPRGQIEPQETP